MGLISGRHLFETRRLLEVLQYLKTLWQYYRDEPAIDPNVNIIDFPANYNNSNSFKFKQQLTGQIGNSGTKNVAIMVPLKYLSIFWRILEMLLIICEITFQLTCSKKRFLVAGTAANQVPKFKITGTKLYVPVVTLSTQDNIKLLKPLQSAFKRTINWNKYNSTKSSQAQNR